MSIAIFRYFNTGQMEHEHLAKRIHHINREHLQWNRDMDKGFYVIGSHHIYASPLPATCFSDNELMQTAEHLEETMPLNGDIQYYVAAFADSQRRAAMSFETAPDFGAGACNHVVWLSGQWEPIHPAVQRYALAHEYSRCVMREMALFSTAKKQMLMGNQVESLLKKYAELRGVKFDGDNTLPNQRRSTEELACHDIRLCVFRLEPEFWPHEEINPEHNAPLRDTVKNYWRGLMNKYSLPP